MRRIISTEAVCLHTTPFRESSKLVSLFTPEYGRIAGVAKGARRTRSKFGAALEVCAVSRVIYYWRESRSLYTLTDAELIRSAVRLSQTPGRFLAAEQMTEFVLKATAPHDPHPLLYQLLLAYLSTLEAAERNYPLLVSSFLLKAATFLGFRPELRCCLVCRRPAEGTLAVFFDPARGGIVCTTCSGESPDRLRLKPEELEVLQRLLLTPADELASRSFPSSLPRFLDLVLRFLARHFDPLLLNSFCWPQGL